MKETIRIFDIFCVSADDGQRIHDKIVPLLREGKQVVLSFERVETFSVAFLNAAIGQLYGEFPEERIQELISFCGMDEVILNCVVDNAKSYFNAPKEFDRAWKDEVG